MAFAIPTIKENVLITPYGGQLVNLLVDQEEKQGLKEYATRLHSVQLSMRNVYDLEMLTVGAFSPLDRFMGKRDYKCVLNESHLASGYLFPIPVTLSVEPCPEIKLGAEIALRDLKNNLLAVMAIHEIYEWNLAHEAKSVFGSTDMRHPFIAEMSGYGKVNISGPMRVYQLPPHEDYREMRLTPAQTRARLTAQGHHNVIAFQTRKPLHRAHEELTRRVVHEVDGALLLHPMVGMTKPGDVDHYERVRTYRALAERYYDPARVTLALLPLAMRMAGPRAVWHMIIRRNYGANYMIVGRDHAAPGTDSNGRPFYGPYDAQRIAELYSAEVGVKVVPFRQFVYLPEDARHEEASSAARSARFATIYTKTPVWTNQYPRQR